MIIDRPPGKPLFPEFPDGEEEIQPASLPFDIALLNQDITNYFNPLSPPVTQEDDLSNPLNTAHEDDIVLPPDTQSVDSDSNVQGAVEGFQPGTKLSPTISQPDGLDELNQRNAEDASSKQQEASEPGLKPPPQGPSTKLASSDVGDKLVERFQPGPKQQPKNTKSKKPESPSKPDVLDEPNQGNAKDASSNQKDASQSGLKPPPPLQEPSKNSLIVEKGDKQVEGSQPEPKHSIKGSKKKRQSHLPNQMFLIIQMNQI